MFYIYSLYIQTEKTSKRISLECKTLTIFYIFFNFVYFHPTSNKTDHSFTSLQSLWLKSFPSSENSITHQRCYWRLNEIIKTVNEFRVMALCFAMVSFKSWTWIYSELLPKLSYEFYDASPIIFLWWATLDLDDLSSMCFFVDFW